MAVNNPISAKDVQGLVLFAACLFGCKKTAAGQQACGLMSQPVLSARRSPPTVSIVAITQA